MHDFPPIELNDFIGAMSRMANGVNVVTTDGIAGREGVTVSSACSVTGEPPSLLACIQHRTSAAESIEHNGVLCLNVLSAEQQQISEVFAGRIKGVEDRFTYGEWHQSLTGSPVLSGAVASFDCTVDHMLTEGTHRIFIARVVAATAGDAAPLIYSRRDYAKIIWS